MMRSVSVVIPTYNGLELLRKNLPPLVEALDSAGAEWEVIVVDDAGTDGTARFLRENHPAVRLLVNETNMGFARTINRGISAARHDVIMALNNDVTVEKNVFAAMLPRFDDPGVFAVTPNVLDPATRTNQAVFKLKPGKCWFTDIGLQEYPRNGEVELFFASGGSSCYSGDKLRELKGFDPVYHPFYVEDLDLSYRAWKRGWRSVLEPGAVVWHATNTTIARYHRRRNVKFVTARNKVMFLWMNFTDPWLVARYWLLFVPSLLWDVVTFRKYKFFGTFMALGRLGDVIRGRRARRGNSVLSDREIIERVSYRNP